MSTNLEHKDRVLEQIGRNPGLYTATQLADSIKKYANLALSDFKKIGNFPSDKYAEIEGIVANDTWIEINNLPTDTTENIQNALNRISQFKGEYPSQKDKAQDLTDTLLNKLNQLEAERKRSESEEKAQREQSEWANVNTNDNSSLRRYLSKYPDSVHKDEIDDYMWNNVQLACTPFSFQSYITDNPHGKYVNEARTSLAFFDEWDKICKEDDIFQVNYYRTTLGKTSPFYAKVNDKYNVLRNEELKKMRQNPSEYDKDTVDRLISAGIFTENELIYENLMSAKPPVDRELLPNLMGLQGENCLPPASPDCTDIYLFGTPSTGKTCLLMGLVASNGQGYNLNFAVGAGDYAGALQQYVEAGVVPGRTNNQWVAAISGQSVEDVGHQMIAHNFNLIEMSGEQFAFRMVKGKTVNFEDMGLGATQILKNDNRKCFLIIVDCSNDSITYKWQEEYEVDGQKMTRPRKERINQNTILTKFVGMFTLPSNQSIMDKVDSIHFVVTKADLLGETPEEQLQNARNLLLKKYIGPINQLKTYCKHTGRINVATNFCPHVFTFSLGRFFLGDVYEYNNYDTLQIMDTLKYITCGVKEPNVLDKIKAVLNKPII